MQQWVAMHSARIGTSGSPFTCSREPFPESLDFERFGVGIEQGLLEPSRLATLISFIPEGGNEETRLISFVLFLLEFEVFLEWCGVLVTCH